MFQSTKVAKATSHNPRTTANTKLSSTPNHESHSAGSLGTMLPLGESRYITSVSTWRGGIAHKKEFWIIAHPLDSMRVGFVKPTEGKSSLWLSIPGQSTMIVEEMCNRMTIYPSQPPPLIGQPVSYETDLP